MNADASLNSGDPFRDTKIRQLFANQTIGTTANLVNATILGFIQWPMVHATTLAAWWSAIAIITLARTLVRRQFFRSLDTAAHTHFWLTLFLAGALCSGIFWGAAGILLFPHGSVVHQMFTAFTIGGMVAGATAAYAPMRRVYLAFSLPAMIPVMVHSYAFHDQVHVSMSAMMLLFLILMTGTCFLNYRSNHASVQLKFENKDLIAFLSEAKARSEAIANELKIENAERLKAECELGEHQKILEHMVEKRTAELERRNQQLRLEINERHRAQAALEESQERYRLLVENANVGIALVCKGMVLFANPFATIIAGRSETEIKTIPFLEFIHPDDRQMATEYHMKRLQQENVPETYQIRLVTKEDETRWVENTAVRISYENKPAVLIFFRDITRQRKLEAQLVHSEKMAAIGQLAAGVAHEINNPVGFVNSNLNTLKSYMDDCCRLIDRYQDCHGDLKVALADGFKNPMIKEKVAAIEAFEQQIDVNYIFEDGPELIRESMEGTDRIKNIVIDLKNFAHPGELVCQRVDINRSIESTLNIVWNELKYHAVVTKQFGELPEILAHPQQINQVFVNLLVNAAQAIEGKGEIKIQTGVREEWVEIKISDTGCGIPAENLSKIFDPFFTTKPVGKGTGLGLNLSYNIIQKHRGVIEVASQVGKGTTFTVRLPVDAN